MQSFILRLFRFAKWVFAQLATAWVLIATAYFLVTETWTFLMSFATYAIISLASEAFFTGLTHQLRRFKKRERIDWRLPCQPFLWSVVVYGLSAAVSFRIIEVVHPAFFHWHWVLRGVAYMTSIYLWEYFWGWRIEALVGSVPWKYRESPWRIWRYVNPYYFWSWYCFGFVLEFIHLRLIPVLPNVISP